MSKRLQVVLEDAEYREMQKIARKHHMTLSEWVRFALRTMRRQEPTIDAGRKLSAVREGARFTYPAPDIEQMLGEIEAGYRSRHDS
jgi:hypothetical protein